MQRIAVILNPVSGAKGRSNTKRTLLNTLRYGAEQKLYKVNFFRTHKAKQATQLAAKAAQDGYDLIICCGGDGTVNETSAALLGASVPLAIIPAGSGNGLARHLGIPLSVRGALNAALHGNTIRMDCGTIAGQHFCTTAGIGLDAEVGWLFAQLEGRGMAAYVQATAQLYFKYTPREYSITINGVQTKETALLITFANASQFGNNAAIAPKASVCDGKLDLVIVRPFPKIEIGILAAMLFSKTLDQSPYIKTQSFDTLHIETSQPIRGHADGEPITLPAAFDVSVRPGAISMRTPLQRTNPLLATSQELLNTLRKQPLFKSTSETLSKNLAKNLKAFEKRQEVLLKKLQASAKAFRTNGNLKRKK